MVSKGFRLRQNTQNVTLMRRKDTKGSSKGSDWLYCNTKAERFEMLRLHYSRWWVYQFVHSLSNAGEVIKMEESSKVLWDKKVLAKQKEKFYRS